MQKIGVENIKIYSNVKRGGDGLVMTQKCENSCFNAKYVMV